ncbi:cysteine desulfurase family protein [Psychroflexus maritimus]|uniref:cysteine desulfurase n=1 Tax=Psychroflexus maritimus TaxID=2714865 RepID=A0A967DYY4_9FLAO|nr:cysteine desulfurase family protein [Psychroflexus maritimus]NGZ88867.1 cysteine desulfurase [Psychroflexus maritimus]
MNSVYFDNAATTKMRKEVVACMQESMLENFGNPSSSHTFGRKAKSAIEQSRKSIAQLINAEASELIFTSGGTEADNIILKSAVQKHGIKRIISTKIEHHAVLNTVLALEAQKQVEFIALNLDKNGNPDLHQLELLLNQSSEKTLISLMHINNEIGNLLDLKKVCQLAHQHQALVHSDSVQSIGHYAIDVKDLEVDFLAASAHKFHGPKGVGFAYAKKGLGLKSMILGGGQEKGSRAGTENVHGILGMEKALELSLKNLATESKYILELKSYFIEQLKKNVPEILFNGESGNLNRSTYTLVNFSLPVNESLAALLLFQLDLKGIACSKGSACQSGSNQGSFVLNEIYDEERLKKPGLRFSFSKNNTKEEIDYAIKVLTEFSHSNPNTKNAVTV